MNWLSTPMPTEDIDLWMVDGHHTFEWTSLRIEESFPYTGKLNHIAHRLIKFIAKQG